jgi:CO/xanthine dehydrogenase Mo-binding subunit
MPQRSEWEISLVPPMAAIANAIQDAVGIRMNKLPMSPGNVLETIWEHK